MQNTVRCCECRCVDKEKSICKLTGRQVKVDAERHCKRFGKMEKTA